MCNPYLSKRHSRNTMSFFYFKIFGIYFIKLYLLENNNTMIYLIDGYNKFAATLSEISSSTYYILELENLQTQSKIDTILYDHSPSPERYNLFYMNVSADTGLTRSTSGLTASTLYNIELGSYNYKFYDKDKSTVLEIGKVLYKSTPVILTNTPTNNIYIYNPD